MKAILILDVNDDTDLSSEADVIIDNGDFHLETKVFLKPMPEELDATEIAIQCGKYEVSDKLVYQVEGYNWCIKQILWEEE